MTSSIVNSITTTPKKQKIRGVVRNATEQEWLGVHVVPDKGEIIYTSDKNTFKVGDGVTPYPDLPTTGSSLNIKNVVNKSDDIPEATEENKGDVYLYNGENTSSFIHGYIYENQESVTYFGVIYFEPSNKITFNFLDNSLSSFFEDNNIANYQNITHGTMTYLLDGNLWVIEGKDEEENIVCDNLRLYTEDLEDAGFTFIVPMTDFSDGEVIDYTTTFTPQYSYSWVRIDVQPGGGGGGAVDSVNGKTGVVVLDAHDVGALSSSDIKTVNGNSLVGSGNVELSTYLPFPNTWDTGHTTKDFCDDINADVTAVEGMAYLGEVTFTDMPNNIGNAECVAEIMMQNPSSKTIKLTLTSGNVAPYMWVYTYWNNGTNVSGWQTWATSAQGSLADTALQPGDLSNYVTTNTTQTISGEKTFSGIMNYSAGKTYILAGNGGTKLGYWSYDIDGQSNITLQTMTASTRNINFKTNNGGKVTYNGSEIAKKSEIPTVNDSTITITQGGVTKGSFTLNQSSGDTIALDAGGLVGDFVPQYSTMPTASVSNLGQIVQYKGTTDINYTNGYFYKCEVDSEDPTSYVWNNVQVQTIENNYANIINKPSINSVTLSGSLTSTDLGILSDITQGSNITIDKTNPANPVISATGQVNSDWNAASGLAQILNKPSLATVATSGSYGDLLNKPTIPAAQVNSDWNSSSGVSEILNKPDLSVYASASDVTTIQSYIPSTTTTSNQLADKAFVNSSISNMAANYVTSDAQGDNFATHAALIAGPYYYKGQSYTLTNNDYALVESDEDHSNATTRYMYNGAQWAFQYIVNNAPFTQAQLDAINSGITSNKVSRYDSLVSNVQADWSSSSGLSQILNKPSLATVATSGLYSDLTGTPTLATVATSGDYDDLLNKPTIPTIPCIVIDYTVTAATGVINVETNKEPTTKTVKEVIGGATIAGTWTTTDTTHYVFTPTTASDILSNANGFLIKVI